MNGFALVMLLAVIASLGAIVTFIPYLTRKTESFGVSIEAKHFDDPEIRAMRRSYVTGTGLSAILALLVAIAAAVSLENDDLGWLMPVLVGWILLVQTVLYLRFHFRMKTLKQTKGLLSAEMQHTVVETGFHREKRAYSQVWFFPHLIVTAATAWLCIGFYDVFPDRIVMQFDFQGNPTNVVDKSYAAVLMPVWLQLFLILVFWIGNKGIAMSKQQIDAANPQVTLRQNLIFRRKWSGFLLTNGFLMTLALGMIPLQMLLQFDYQIFISVWAAIIVYTLIALTRLGFVMGQGGSRIRIGESGSESGRGKVNRDDDRYWKLGQFYFNPDDPALFLEKRFGIGWTLNFARPLAWVILLGPLVLILFVTVLVNGGTG
jgi:uncharacterized membrane protein